MNDKLKQTVEGVLSNLLGKTVSIKRMADAGGDCTNEVTGLEVSTGEKFFVKSNATAPADFFECEAEGLRAIRQSATLGAPEPLYVGGPEQDGDPDLPQFIVLEHIESSEAPKGFAESFARGLAEMHRRTSKLFGLQIDNYLDRLPQDNEPCDTWLEFFAERRLGVQFDYLDRQGYATAEFRTKFDLLRNKLDSLVGSHATEPSLVHGDLWSGNFICAPSGEAILIDPALYYGDREVDLATTELFGRFDSKFYAAYREAFPLEPGYEVRRDLYNLYHLMNHLNMSGLSFMTGVMDLLRKYV